MLAFLKLGGSLITDKDQPFTVRRGRIQKIAEEVQMSLLSNPNLQILLGHGSGSFGHYAAKESGFSEGVKTKANWFNFQKVWKAARDLNTLVIEEFHTFGLPVVSLPPSAAISAKNKNIFEWNIKPIVHALNNNLIPVIFGDTIFDISEGCIILSTEELFQFLIDHLNPWRIILAGKERGVWADFPNNQNLIPKISPDNYAEVKELISTSSSIDVTGGMAKKVNLMIQIVTKNPKIIVDIISGEIGGNISDSLKGKSHGTVISA